MINFNNYKNYVEERNNRKKEATKIILEEIEKNFDTVADESLKKMVL